MTTISFAQELYTSYERFRVSDFTKRHFSPEELQSCVNRLHKLAGSILSAREAGRSFEGRPIQLISVGNGPLSVLLWTQMHGDESTATMAVIDILHYFIATQKEKITQKICSSLTIHVLPMLNPDGAARTQRRTAQGIDMNRDALALATPEANILKQHQQQIRPKFGFNLHDQELSTVATSKELTAIALLAPAFNQEKSDNEVRKKAKHLAAIFAEVMNEFAAGKIGRYDDTFEPRAFGDNMQKWGTSTLLVESGHAMNDPEKHSIRKLNFVGILASLYAIAMNEYSGSNISRYEQLPFNGKKAYDVIIRNVTIDHGGGKHTQADLGISYQVDTHSEPTPKLADLGDLHTFTGLKEIEGRGKSILSSSLSLGNAFAWENYF
jgi:hypothetical protein